MMRMTAQKPSVMYWYVAVPTQLQQQQTKKETIVASKLTTNTGILMPTTPYLLVKLLLTPASDLLANIFFGGAL